jgi:hypothetical protein
MVQAKIMRRHLHTLHQFLRFIDYCGSVTPSKDCREKTGNLNIRLLRKKMGNTNRVIADEKRLIILINLFIQKFF